MQRGAAPARRRALPAVLAALAALAAIATTATFALRRSETPPAPAATTEQVAAVRPIAEKTLALERGCRAVKPNLHIEGSAVQFDIAFQDDSGKTVAGGESFTVKHSCKRKFKVPPDARKAVFSIRRIREDDTTRITEFAPEALQVSF